MAPAKYPRNLLKSSSSKNHGMLQQLPRGALEASVGAFCDPKGRIHKSEYPNKCHVRDVTNSEKHPRIIENKQKKLKAFSPSLSADTQISENKSTGKSSSFLGLLQPIVRIVPVNFKEAYEEPNGSAIGNQGFDQYYSKKKKRKTEQEKLIASLNRTELPHVDGAFKRSTTIRYRNLNEDKLLDNLFDSRVGKPRRSSGKKMLCIGDIPRAAGEESSMKLTKKVKQQDFTSEIEAKLLESASEARTEPETETMVPENVEEVSKSVMELNRESLNVKEHKKKRKTEKEKLIENLSAIERIHVDGAFKRKTYNANSSKAKSKGSENSEPKKTDVFSPVRFMGLDGDIESLILEKTGGDAT